MTTSRGLTRAAERAIAPVPLRLALGLLVLFTLPAALAVPAAAEPGDPSIAPSSMLDPAWVRAPAAYSAGQTEHLREGVSLEARGRSSEATAVYVDLAASVPSDANAHWRAARTLFDAAERIPSEQRDTRIELLERSRTWAARGLSIDPHCAECMLFQAAAIGRLSTIYGVVWGGKHVREIAALLDGGIELEPHDRDGPSNSTLANLYFARAVLYRTVPEWFWLRFVIGMRGDIDRALADIRLARAIHPERLDYHVEHGVILLCRGQRRDDPESKRRGTEELEAAARQPARFATDHKDLHMVAELLKNPARACEFSRDGFMDIEEHKHRESQ